MEIMFILLALVKGEIFARLIEGDNRSHRVNIILKALVIGQSNVLDGKLGKGGVVFRGMPVYARGSGILLAFVHLFTNLSTNFKDLGIDLLGPRLVHRVPVQEEQKGFLDLRGECRNRTTAVAGCQSIIDSVYRHF